MRATNQNQWVFSPTLLLLVPLGVRAVVIERPVHTGLLEVGDVHLALLREESSPRLEGSKGSERKSEIITHPLAEDIAWRDRRVLEEVLPQLAWVRPARVLRGGFAGGEERVDKARHLDHTPNQLSSLSRSLMVIDSPSTQSQACSRACRRRACNPAAAPAEPSARG